MSPNIDTKIEKYEDKIIKNRLRIKSSESRDALQRVFDERTVDFIYKLLRNGVIGKIIGIVSQGKEANVYFAKDLKENPIAIKIYKIDGQSAKWMKKYIIGDPRFKKVGNSPDKIIFLWCSKEYKNLLKIYKSNISCPKPIFSRNNVLIMEYIGSTDGTPARKLKDVIGEVEDPYKELEISLKFIEDLYKKAKLVHGDLSEFNILYHQNEQYLIDVSQSISIMHPKALYFLSRDIKNIIDFYLRIGIKTPNPEDIYKKILN
ncbi:MAG: serine protein kinase RIO [Promethearchaeota archaeon]